MSSVERHTRPLGLNVWPACIGFHRAMCGMQGEILRWQKKNNSCDHSTIALYYDASNIQTILAHQHIDCQSGRKI